MEPRNTLTPSDDPNAIEGAIDETRREIASTVDEIENRLSPAHLREKAREATVGKAETMARNVRDRARASGRSAIDTVRENPIPYAMIGIGVMWLVRERSKGEGASDRS